MTKTPAPAKRLSLAILLAAGLASTALGQLQWSAYDKTGALVSGNAASGGDATYGQPVTFTVPAATQRIFMTKSFAPISLTTAGALQRVNFTMVAAGGLYPGATGRLLGMGLFNDPGTPGTAADDTGYWCDFNTANPSFELFYRPSGLTSFFAYDSSHKLGTGTLKTGNPTNNVNYGMQFQLDNSGNTGISIGTSSSTFPAAGAAMTNGTGGVVQQAYSSVNALTTLPTSTFNEFAFMFYNPSASAVTVTLSGMNLVPLNPGITSNPADFNGSPGTNATFTVGISPTSATPLSYQWYESAGGVTNALVDGLTANGSTISGSTNATLTFTNAQIADSGFVFAVVTNSYGASTSSSALLNIANDTAPAIFSLIPTNANLIAGQGTNVTVRATGVPAPAYYWLDNSNNLVLTGTNELVLSNLQAANAGTYTVIASNYLGSVSSNFFIGVYIPPCISQQPTNVLVNVGDSVTFAVTEGGCAMPAPSYQWFKNGVAISGATGASYSITSVAVGDIGYYSVQLSNPGGTVTSASARLAVYSTTLTGAPLSPAINATGICYDTPLYLSFNQTASVGNTGKVNIYNATNLVTPVDTIDLSANNARGLQTRSPFPGDSQTFNYYPVVITGGTNAAIYPHSGVMTSNQTYVVTIDPGVIVDASGAYWPGITNTSTWSFTTKPTGPANPTNLVVAADGSGDFVTVQGAVDSIPLNNTTPTLINIAPGNYFEIVDIASKPFVTFRGQSRTGSLIYYPNNANVAFGGSTHARMTFKVNSSDVVLENLSISNSTPQGGSQAEALMIESGAQRCIVDGVTISSLQDTILANVNSSQGYFQDSTVRGNYDYVWGGGNLFFSRCNFHTVAGASGFNLTAARTDYGTTSSTGNWETPDGTKWSSNGLSFVQCTMDADAGVANITLADANGTPGGLASWVGCSFSPAYVAPSATLSNSYNFWQFQNTDALGNPTNFANVQGLTNGDPRLLAVTNVPVWLYGWSPVLAPVILTNPASQSIAGSSTLTLTVSALGVPGPAYQWTKNGTNLAGQTRATLTIPSANVNDSGTYAVVVTTPGGSLTSSSASVTVSNSPPSLAPIADQTVNVGVNVQFTPVASDPDVPPQTLSFSLTRGPTNATINPASGAFSFRPTVSQANTTNLFTMMVADNGSPSLSASQSFQVIVNPLTQPTLSSPTWSGGQFGLTFNGEVGPDYIVLGSTNLVDWTPLATNTPTSMPFQWTDPGAGSLPWRFYRLQVGP